MARRSIELVDAVMAADDVGPRASRSLRPPGHHARPDRGMGFCLVNSVAVAAALRARPLACSSWMDVHRQRHARDVLPRSSGALHLDAPIPVLSGHGRRRRARRRRRTRSTVRVPLFAGGGDAVYRAAFEQVILDRRAAELVLVSAGFDPAQRPLAGMSAAAWTRMAARAPTRCRGRSAGGRMITLEGGDLPSLESGLAATITGPTTRAASEISRNPADAADVYAATAASAAWSVVE
ncbi:MAG: hypothetical protein U0235_21100 [Polyangiaceae bacterium]